MKYNRLGSSDLYVSKMALGTNTFGLKNTEEEAHAILDYAITHGINFIDTAEVYPTPRCEEQVPGSSERILGSYLAKNPVIRSKLIIATKVAGFEESSDVAANRQDPPLKPYPTNRLTAENIHAACSASLKRLQTDYIDLYYLHWPDRYVPIFGNREYKLERERESVPIRDSLLALKQLLDDGKIRTYGLSNETAFGICQFVRVADELGLPRPVAIQNSFCLLDRHFESDLAEACAPRNFNISLLPWCPLGGGVLTGKYNGKIGKDGSVLDPDISQARHVLRPNFQSRYLTAATLKATEKYMSIAKHHNISVATLALAFTKSRWYIPSTIVGCSSLEHVKANIDSFDVDLEKNVLEQIDKVHFLNKDPVIQV